MIDIKAITDYLVSHASATSTDEALSNVDNYLSTKKSNHLWSAIKQEIDKRSIQQTERDQLVLKSADHNSTLLNSNTFAQENFNLNNHTQLIQDDRLLAGEVMESSERKLDLTVRKQVIKLHRELTR